MVKGLAGIGYEGRTVEELVDVLRGAEVEVVVDVRLNPVSRKPGLSKRRLAARLQEDGIEYRHEPDLGNPKDNRDGFHSARPEAARQRFRERLRSTGAEAVGRVVLLAADRRVALLCFEHDRHRCHRDLVLARATELDVTVPVVDL